MLKDQGRTDEADVVAAEGARKGDFRCRRLWAGMEQEDFEKLTPERQTALHKKVAEGLDYAIACHDRFACYLKGCIDYLGIMGFERDWANALKPLRRGLEMGEGRCAWLLAAIQESRELPTELQVNSSEVACLRLQAVRLGEDSLENLQEVAKANVCGLLPEDEDEIEEFHLKAFINKALEVDAGPEATGVLSVYPAGFYYAWDAPEELDLEELAEKMGARGFDVVHFSPLLMRFTNALDLENCHVAMLVDRDSYAKDLPDNMTGTIVYGQGAEIRGPVVFVLETDRGYVLQPLRGLQRTYMLLELLRAATGDLLRQPTSGELVKIGASDTDGFEEFYGDPDIFDNGEPEREIEEDMVSAGSLETEPQEMTFPLLELEEALDKVNLCRDTLFLLLPDEPRYRFVSTEDLFSPIKSKVKANIERHGGYMIDEWWFVDERQVPVDIRSCVRFK